MRFLEKHFLAERKRISDWFQFQWQEINPPVYGSVDLRNAGFKLAPIDMNLFPAGFNNLNPNFMSISVDAAKKVIEKIVPGAKKILVVPESHTRNVPYWKSIQILQSILKNAGFDVRLGILDMSLTSPINIQLDDEVLVVGAISRDQDKLMLNDFVPDFILLNNDLSAGIPEILQHLKQVIIPPAELGWSQRLKSYHFQYYAEVAQEFAAFVKIDPWLIAPLFRHCGKINFMQQEGLECVIDHAQVLFNNIQKKYNEYGISYQPFLVVKADAGTYGMAVMTVRHVDELKSLNRKQRTRMATTKGGQVVDRVIIQEGVYTFETIGEDEAVAEPVLYMWGNYVVGGFYRMHQNRGTDENLNSPGMRFLPIAFTQTCDGRECDVKGNTGPDDYQDRLYLYGVIAELSMLAAAREIRDQGKTSLQ